MAFVDIIVSADQLKTEPIAESNTEPKDKFVTELKFVPDSKPEYAPQPKPEDVPKTEHRPKKESEDWPEPETGVECNQCKSELAHTHHQFVPNLELDDFHQYEPMEDSKSETSDESEIELKEKDSACEPKPKSDVESNPETKDEFSIELKFIPYSEPEYAQQPETEDVPKTECLIESETSSKGKESEDWPEHETEVEFNHERKGELTHEPKFVVISEPEDVPISEPLLDPKTETSDESEIESKEKDSADEPEPKPDVDSNPEPKDEFSTELKFVPDSEHENAPQPKPEDVPKAERFVKSETGSKGKDGSELETEVKFSQEPQDELADEPKFVSNLEPEDLPIPEPVEDPKTETLDEPKVALTEKRDIYRRLAQKYNLTDDCVVPVKDASNQEELIIIYDPSCNKVRKLKEFGHDIMIRNPKYVSTEGAIVSSICKNKQYPIRPEDRNNLKQILNHHSNRLFASHSNLNIITTSPVKSKKKGENISECPCIVLVCSSKGYIPKGESKFPEEMRNENTSFVVDIREGYFQFCPTSYTTFNSSFFHQHIKMGCSFGIEGTHNAGTVGPFVDVQGHQLFLTCAHIVTGVDPNGYDLNNIQNMFAEQPDAMTLSDPQNQGHITQRCGEVRRAVFLPNNSPSVDAAVVEITEQSRMPSRGEFAIDSDLNLKAAKFDDPPRFDSGDIHDDPDTLDTDLRIVKFGAKTHATHGLIESHGTSARPLTTYLGLQGQPNMCVMQNQLEVRSLQGYSNFLPGDSGAGVFVVNKLPTGEQKLTCIGLAIGCTSYGSAVVTPIAAVLDALGLPRKLKQFP